MLSRLLKKRRKEERKKIEEELLKVQRENKTKNVFPFCTNTELLKNAPELKVGLHSDTFQLTINISYPLRANSIAPF